MNLAGLLWHREEIGSGEVVRLCEKELVEKDDGLDDALESLLT